MKTILAIFVLVVAANCLVAKAYADTIGVTVDGYIQDQGGPPIIDYYWLVMIKHDSNGETRGIAEFDLSSITGPIQTATLRMWQLDLQLNYSGGTGLYAYSGDGQITVSDYSTSAGFVTSITWPTGYNFGYGVPFDIDVSSALQMGLDEDWSFLGFRVQKGLGSGDVHYAAAGTAEWPYFGGSPPLLMYEIPEPATLILMAGGLPLLLKRKRKSRRTSGLVLGACLPVFRRKTR